MPNNLSNILLAAAPLVGAIFLQAFLSSKLEERIRGVAPYVIAFLGFILGGWVAGTTLGPTAGFGFMLLGLSVAVLFVGIAVWFWYPLTLYESLDVAIKSGAIALPLLILSLIVRY